MQTREEHLKWCKQRAMQYVETGDYNSAVASMISDLGKRPEMDRQERSADRGGMTMGFKIFPPHNTEVCE